MAYFDATSETDLRLLPQAMKKNPELQRIADDAEADIVAAYTDTMQRSTVGEYRSDIFELADGKHGVFLRGYNSDVTSATGYDADRNNWSGFAAAMRRAVAKIVEHRLRYEGDDPSIVQETRGRRTVVRKRPVNQKYPSGWRDLLSLYDIRQPVYII